MDVGGKSVGMGGYDQQDGRGIAVCGPFDDVLQRSVALEASKACGPHQHQGADCAGEEDLIRSVGGIAHNLQAEPAA
jgi:hypothetical protein